VASRFLCDHPRFQGRDQRGEIFLHGLPEDIQIDVKVPMNQPVTHADDVIPGNALQLISCNFGDLEACFADDLDILNERLD